MIPTKLRFPWAVLVFVLAVLAGGCATSPFRVQPWDRDLLAQKKMSFDPAPMIGALDDHIYFSKEASTGGRTTAGGGCGCN